MRDRQKPRSPLNLDFEPRSFSLVVLPRAPDLGHEIKARRNAIPCAQLGSVKVLIAIVLTKPAAADRWNAMIIEPFRRRSDRSIEPAGIPRQTDRRAVLIDGNWFRGKLRSGDGRTFFMLPFCARCDGKRMRMIDVQRSARRSPKVRVVLICVFGKVHEPPEHSHIEGMPRQL